MRAENRVGLQTSEMRAGVGILRGCLGTGFGVRNGISAPDGVYYRYSAQRSGFEQERPGPGVVN